MPGRTRHRRRFHTDRIVPHAAPATFARSHFLLGRAEMRGRDHAEWLARLLAHGHLASTDPWDCGRHCVMCHAGKLLEPRRARETRAWRREWDLP